ncbi:MAG: hypothetical protein IPJ24_15085 [bacterium]|nr:hypothetical protein [bacterium]
MKTLRTLIVGMGLLALMATAATGDARAETPKTKPEAAKSTAKSTSKDKAADAKADGKTAEPVRAPAVFPANPALKDWLSKAGTDSFFLVLDESAKKLQLVLGGVVIRNFDVAEVKVATPRRLGGAAPLPRDWHERVWTGARLDPPHPGARTEIVGPEVGTATGEVMVPPTPEEAIPVPSLYRIRFAEGLALEVTGGVAEQKGELPPNELATGFREKIRMLREGAPDLLRVRIQLTPEAYSEMYRSLPPGTDFVVMHADE